MKALNRKQVTGVIQYSADGVNHLYPGTSFVVKGLLKGAELYLDRRKRAEEVYEGSPGYLIKKSVGDVQNLDAFKRFPARSDVASNVNQALKELPFDIRLAKVKKLWDIVLDNWGTPSDEFFLIVAVLTGSAELVPRMPIQSAEVLRRCQRAIDEFDISKVRFVESMSFVLQWSGKSKINADREHLQLSSYDWGREDYLTSINFMGSRWALVNDILSGLADPEGSVLRRQFEVGRFIHHLRESPWEEFSSRETIRDTGKLFWRLRSDHKLLRAAETALSDAAEVARNRA